MMELREDEQQEDDDAPLRSPFDSSDSTVKRFDLLLGEDSLIHYFISSSTN